MKICMFTNTFHPHVGGVARSVEIFSEDLGSMGHRVLVIAPTFPDCESSDEAAPDEAAILRVPAIQEFNGSDFSVRIPVPYYIDEKLDAFAPDVIHSHHPYLLGDAALRGAWRRGLPLVFTHHTRYEEYTHYVTTESETMKRFAINLCTEYANRCTRVIAPSRSIADLIRDRGVSVSVDVIPTGVDLDFFARGDGAAFRKDREISSDTLLIGHLGRLAPEKNLSYLAEAVSRYVKNDPAAKFLVVGAGPSEADIRRIFQEEDIGDRLIMAGELTGRTLADAYHAMDVFVFSSKSETQGMVVAEAMACGKPVIALDASGIREVVSDDENGRLLAEDASADAFSDAIADFAEHPDAAARWRKGALETAEALDRNACAKRLVSLYETAIQTAANADRAPEGADALEIWDRILINTKTEWELLTQKASAVADTIRESVAAK